MQSQWLRYHSCTVFSTPILFRRSWITVAYVRNQASSWRPRSWLEYVGGPGLAHNRDAMNRSWLGRLGYFFWFSLQFREPGTRRHLFLVYTFRSRVALSFIGQIMTVSLGYLADLVHNERFHVSLCIMLECGVGVQLPAVIP